MTIRHVFKNAQGAADGCYLCGSRWGIDRRTNQNACDATTCMWCLTRQCMVNGLGNGTCRFCFVGLLPGWGGNDQTCRYKNCGKEAVARGTRGKAYVCADHALQQYTSHYLEYARDPRNYQERDDAGYTFRENSFSVAYHEARIAKEVPA